MKGRIRTTLSTLVCGLALSSAACTEAEFQASAAEPVTVAVAFDRETTTPLIVEGLADPTTGRAVEANDPVRVASISKLVMALAALRLAEEGVVDLDADVSQYLGWQLRSPNYPDTPITLAQILAHRAGLRDNGGYIIPLGESLEEKLAQADAWYADAPPGQAPFEYANIGSPVVASALEAASGERYDDLIERLVFAPLDIEACINWTRCSAQQVARAVGLYRDTGEPARDFPEDLPPDCSIPVADGVECDLSNYEPGSNASVFSPQGGVRMGMVDLARLGQALVSEGGDWLSEASLARLITSADPVVEGQTFFCGYGLAIQKIETPGRECVDALFKDGVARYGHGGEAYGLRSGLWFDPETGTGLAFFTTAVPPRTGPEGESSPREIEAVQRALAALSETGS